MHFITCQCCGESTLKFPDNRVPSGSNCRAIAACSMPKNMHSSSFLFACITYWSLLWRNYLHIVTQFGDLLQSLREALDEQLQHASRPMNMHFSPVFCMHIITNRSLLWRNYVKIVRQSGYPSSALGKHLTNHSGRTEKDFALIFF